MRFNDRIAQAAGQQPGLMDAMGVLQGMLADFGEAKAAELAVLLAAARALQHIHQTHHWQVRGGSFYGDHLLYARLYEGVDAEVDGLAEKVIGITGQAVMVQPVLTVDHELTFAKCMYSGAEVTPGPEDLPALSLRAELCFLLLIQYCYKLMEAKGDLSLGVDNQLQGIYDKHESHVYLLQQRLGGRSASLVARVAQRSRA